MALMKCPKCGTTAEAPDSAAEDPLRCYGCNVALIETDPAARMRRSQSEAWVIGGAATGAICGAAALCLIGFAGGEISRVVNDGMAGALFGGVFILVILGSYHVVVIFPSDGVLSALWLLMCLGATVGFILGATGSVPPRFKNLPTPELSLCSVLLLGGASGGWLGKCLWERSSASSTRDQGHP